MGFVRTREEIDHYFGLAVRHFPGARMLGMLWETDPDVVARLLPPPLEPAAEAWASTYCAHFPDTNLGPGYRECALFVRCRHGDEVGNYCLSMPLDGGDDRVFNGREIYGFPKKTARIELVREGNRAEASCERHGIRFFSLSAELTTPMDEPPIQVGPNYLFKFQPRADLRPGFEGPVLLVRQKTDLEFLSFELGSGELRFEPSPFDPWSEVVCKNPIATYWVTSNNTMQRGEVVGEADPEAFLPHSFARTDWGFEA